VTKTPQAVIQRRYRQRKASGKVIVTWEVEPEDAAEFFRALRIAVPAAPTAKDLADCLDALIERVIQ
jgi:hypothetical protein